MSRIKWQSKGDQQGGGKRFAFSNTVVRRHRLIVRLQRLIDGVIKEIFDNAALLIVPGVRQCAVLCAVIKQSEQGVRDGIHG